MKRLLNWLTLAIAAPILAFFLGLLAGIWGTPPAKAEPPVIVKVPSPEACASWWFGEDKPSDFKAARHRICGAKK